MIEKLSKAISENMTIKEIKKELELLGLKDLEEFKKKELAIYLAQELLYRKENK